MTEEEKLAALWEIAQKVAEEDPTYETNSGDVECFYCNGDRNYRKKLFEHDASCIVTRARALVKEKGNN